MKAAILVLLLLSLLFSGRLGAAADASTFLELLQQTQTSDPILVGAHRGGRLMWPENTRFAFEQAAKRYPQLLLEGDAQMTADGQVILLHDATVDRTTNGLGPVASFTLAQLQELDAAYYFTRDGGKSFPLRGKGVRIPTLASVLAVAPEHPFLIELKGGAGLVAAVVRVVREAQAGHRFIAASFKPGLMKEFRETAPEIAVCFDLPEALRMMKALRKGGWESYRPKAQLISFSPDLVKRFHLTRSDIEAMQAKKIHVQVHTINERKAFEQWRSMGVDSLLTDCPDKIYAWMAE